MSWEFYEVWSVDQDYHEELVDTTQSFKEAQDLASAALDDENIIKAIIYKENEDGDLEEVQVLE